SATAAAHDHERVAPVNVKRNVIEHHPVSEFSHEIGYFDDGFSVRIHTPKKKIPVSTAFITNIASNACTTEAVVAWPTPSAPPSTVKPALQAIVMTIHAKTTLLIIPEYKSHVSALSRARNTYPAVLKSSAKRHTAQPPRMPIDRKGGRGG